MTAANETPRPRVEFYDKIAERYRNPEIFPAAIMPETGEFLRWFIRLTRPKLCVELGTNRGVSALWMAQALRENGGGELHTFDLFELSDPKEAIGHLADVGLGDIVHVHCAPSSTGAAEIIQGLARPVDFIYIDADHRDIAPSADILSFWPLLAMGGFILMHDIFPEKSGWDGPRYALDLLKQANLPPQSACVLELPCRLGPGLAVIQKCQTGKPRLVPWLAYFLYQCRTRFRFWLRRDSGN